MTENQEGLNDQDQYKYRSAVGMLLFLVHYKQILRTVKYIIKTKNKMLKLRTEKKYMKWAFKCLCDSDYV